jgi:hypothetical protein
MRKDRGRWIALAAAIPIGLVVGFFFVLGPLFTDGPSSLVDLERLASLAFSTGVYLAFAILVAWISRGDRVPLTVLGLPGLALAVWYTVREPGVAVLAIAYVVAMGIAIVLGRTVALRLRGRPAAT